MLSEQMMAAALLYFAQITLSLIFLGIIVKKLNFYTLLTFHSICSGGIIIFAIQLIRPNWFKFKNPVKIFWDRKHDVVTVVLIALLFCEAVWLILQVVAFPPHVWDVQTYHLTPAVEWYQQGKIPHILDTPVTRMKSQCLGLTLLSYWYFIFFQEDTLVELPQLLWALLLVLVAYATLRRNSLEKKWAIRFSVAIFFIPSIIMQATTAKDHIAFNVAFITGLYFFMRFLQLRCVRDLIWGGVALGLMLGYKLTGIVHLAVAWFMLGIYIIMLHPGMISPARQRWSLIRYSLLSLGLSFLLGGYWYIRNILLYGRLQGCYYEKLFDFKHGTWFDVLQYRCGIFFENVLAFFPRVFDSLHVYEVDLTDISGFGPQFAMFGLTAMALGALSLFNKSLRKQPMHLMVYSAWLMIVFYFFLYYTRHNYRLFMFLPAVMLLYSGVWLNANGFLHIRWSSRSLAWMLLIAVIWNFSLLFYPQNIDRQGLKAFFNLDKKYRVSANYWNLARGVEPYATLAMRISPAVKLAYIGQEDTWNYLYYDINWRRRLYYIPDKMLAHTDGVYAPTAMLKKIMKEKQIPLISLCINGQSAVMNAADFEYIVDGLYWFKEVPYEPDAI